MATTVAAKNKAMRREQLLELLANKGLIQKVIADSELVRDLTIEMDPEDLKRIEVAHKMRMDLIKKYLPDVKAMELSGKDGGALTIVMPEAQARL